MAPTGRGPQAFNKAELGLCVTNRLLFTCCLSENLPSTSLQAGSARLRLLDVKITLTLPPGPSSI